MAQKVQLIASVVHQPEFVILDEPFSGLDPMNQQGLEAMIRGLAADGAVLERDPNDASTWGRVGRNEPCPCGSGKKFKHCHGRV